jgi:hypothetical protein
MVRRVKKACFVVVIPSEEEGFSTPRNAKVATGLYPLLILARRPGPCGLKREAVRSLIIHELYII